MQQLQKSKNVDGHPSAICFAFIGGSKRPIQLSLWLKKGFTAFVLNSLNGPAKDELQLCLAGYATVEDIAHEEPIETIAEHSDNSVGETDCHSH